ncbi:MAG TPA: hypothetical protein VK988_17860 [Acidimicrobiales bacterium]|nr:hypothetical protein [Acidimicrobiales bacterium]
MTAPGVSRRSAGSPSALARGLRPAPLPRRRLSISVLMVLAGAMAGPLLVNAPFLTLAGLVALAMLVATFFHPPLAVYVLVGVTPLLAGVDRGALVPGLRPSEAVALLLGVAVLGRALVQIVGAHHDRVRLRRTDLVLVLLVVTGSLVPLVWLLARGHGVAQDDILYSVALWKYLLLYLLVRSTIRTEQQVRRCLCVSLASAGVVGLIGILQALNLFGVPDLLANHYAPGGDTSALYLSRGSSTLAHPQAMADVMVMNLAIALAWLARAKCNRGPLVIASVLFVVASLASGQFSGAVALLTGLGALSLLTRQLRQMILALVPALVVAALLVTPVIEERLNSISQSQGLPTSWIARVDNLKTYVLPELSNDFSYVLGVRPSARIPKNGDADGYVFIESGHLWLLWTGGIPFLVAFFVFVFTNARATARIARRRLDAVGIAAAASFSGLIVLAVVTTFDPHLTLRGAADLNFSLLALAHLGLREMPSAVGPEVSSEVAEAASQARQRSTRAAKV